MTTLSARDIKDIVTDVVRMSLTTNSSLRLEPFSGRDTRELIKWLREFEYHADANNWDDAAKLRKFPTYLRDYGLLWYDQNVKRAASGPTTWAELKALITKDLLSTDHKSYLHSEIIRRKQGNSESVYNYILAKRDLCLELDESMRDPDMIEQLYQGMKPEIAKMLRAHNPRRLTEFIELAKQIERGIDEFELNDHSSNKAESELASLMKNFGEILKDATRTLRETNNQRHNNATFVSNRSLRRFDNGQDIYQRRHHSDDRRSNLNRPQSPEYPRNDRINRAYSPTWIRDQNSARVSTNQRDNIGTRKETAVKRVNFNLNNNPSRTTDGRNICYNCQKPGHHSRNCPLRGSASNRNGQSNASFYVAQAISPSVDNYNNRLMFIDVKINGRFIKGLVDTGSEITMIADKLANDLGLVITEYKGKRINGVNSQPVEITGQTLVNLVVFDADNERSIPITAVTVKDFHLNLLLGYDFHFTSRSLIDIYHNNIVFNSAAKSETSPINIKPLGQKEINKMHSIENIEVPPNGMNVIKCAPSNKRKILHTDCIARSNPNLLSRRKIFVKDQNIKVRDGIASIPVINLSNDPVAISAGSIVSDYELPTLCATATAQDLDLMADPKITKIIEEDSVAYGIFCKIVDLTKGIPEIVSSIACRLCLYCTSIECQEGDQCPKRDFYLNNLSSYRDFVYERRMHVLILSSEYTLRSLLQRGKIGNESTLNDPRVGGNLSTIVFNDVDIKLSAECLFQELYTRAVDETFDKHNVIYFFHRICGFCNRYNCSDPDFQCVHIPALSKSDNYKRFKEAERKELNVLLKEYVERHNLSTDVVEKYRNTKRVIVDLTLKTQDVYQNADVTESVAEDNPKKTDSLHTPEPQYEPISDDDEEFIKDFLQNFPNDFPKELEDLKGLDDCDFLQCNALYSEDLVYESKPIRVLDEAMINRVEGVAEKGKEQWEWLETPYRKIARYGDDNDGSDITEVMDSAIYNFDSLLFLAEQETNDILNVFYYFDHLCRECNICHVNNGHVLGDCRRAKRLHYRNDKPLRIWRDMNHLMHEFIKNSTIPMNVVEEYRRTGPIQNSPLYKLKWTEKGEYFSKGGLWVDKKTKLPMQIRLSDGCMDVNPELTIAQWHRLAKLLYEFDDILAFNPQNIGTCNILQHKIDTGDSPPIHQNPYVYAAPLREEINRQVNELIELDIVTPSKSPWSSPVVLVDKKDGTKRMCVDLRKVNNVTKSDVYPLPSISIALSSMQGAQYFSSLDLNSGYHQIELEESSREKTAFITQNGLFEYKKLMFGLKTAPACFARTMDIVLAGLKWSSVLVYIDDILIFSKDFDSHLEHIREVLQRLQAANLTVKPNKCSLAMNSVKFLGHVIDKTGVRTDPDKIKGIQDFPRPQTLTQVRGFIGRASYYRKFIPYFSEVAEPLSRLTKKNVRYIWGPEQEQAFNQLKQLLSSQPVLTHFDGSKPLEVRCDASVIGLGAELVQLEELGWKLVANASRLLTDAERAYGASERECLAIVYATEKFSPYIHGLKFTVVTDHLALKWLKEKSDLSPRLLRWALHLQKYDFDVVYRSGRLMKDADALSRSPVDPPEAVIDNHDKYSFSSCMAQESNEITENNPYNDLNLPELQNQDPFFGPIYKSLEENDEVFDPIRNSYALKDGILYFSDNYNRKYPKLLTCVPEVLIHELLYSFHDDMMSGHLGINKTKAKIKERYFWPDMDKIIETYVKSCLDCQTKKTPNIPKAGLLVPIKVGGPFEMWGVDILGPFPISDSGNNNVIVATEYMTKFAETAAIPKADKWNVANFIDEHIIFKHGAPLKILTDQGKVFASNLCKQIYSNHEIIHVRTSAYHPATNGLCERFNKTLAEMISQYTSDKQTDWDKCLKYVTFAYNTSVQESTRFSPFMLTYGREPILPADVVMRRPTIGVPDVDQYVELRKNFIEKARELALKNITESQMRNSKHFNKRHREGNFEIGQLVLIHNPRRYKGKAEKLLHQYHGPYRVLEQRGPVNFYVESIRDKYETLIVHVSRMKHFYDRKELFNPSEYEVECSDDDIEEGDAIEETRPEENIFERDSYSPTALSPTDTESEEQEGSDETIIDDQWNDFVLDSEYVPTPISSRENSSILPTPRRSGRVRRPVNRLNLMAKSILSMLFVMVLSTYVDASLTRMSPILWRKSSKPVISGINNVIVSVKFDSPCEVFTDPIFNGTAQNELLIWCKDTYLENFLKPIRGFCNSTISRADTELRFNREKRFIFETFLLATIIITTFTTIGVSTASIVQSAKTKDEVQDAKEKQEELMQAAIDFENNQMKIKQILEKLQTEISDIGLAVIELTNSVKHLQNTIPKAMHVVANLASKLLLTKDRLTDISKKWRNGFVDDKLLEILNMTLPCDCLLNTAQPKECTLDEMRSIITINFDVHSRRKSTSTMEADPFVLYNQRNTSLCAIHYVGPQTVIYDAERDCVTALHQIKQASRNLILMPSSANCQKNIPEAVTKRYWKIDHCAKREFVVDEEIIQIKVSDKFNYIYCHSLNISIYNRSLVCPDYVFAVPNNAPFSINSVTYESSLVNVQNTLSLMPEWTQRINFHLMPKLHDLNLSEIARQTREEINSIKTHEFGRHIVNNYDSVVHFIYISLLIVAIIAITIYFKKRRTQSINQRKIKEIELERHEMRDENFEDSNIERDNHNDDIERIGSPGKLKRAEKVLFLTTIIAVMTPSSTAVDHNYIILSIRFKSPCNVISTNKTNTDNINWCQKQFELAFQQPIKEFCKMSREILSVEEELYTNESFKVRRGIHKNFTKRDIGDLSPFAISSMIASLVVLKGITTNIGRKWIRNEIDPHLIENSRFRIDFPKDVNLREFKPHLCIADFQCNSITLMLKKNDKPWYEKHCLELTVSSSVIMIAIITCIIALKLKKKRPSEPSNYKVLYDRKLSESLVERTLPLPPFPIAPKP
jgi:transposase InsO family protein